MVLISIGNRPIRSTGSDFDFVGISHVKSEKVGLLRFQKAAISFIIVVRQNIVIIYFCVHILPSTVPIHRAVIFGQFHMHAHVKQTNLSKKWEQTFLTVHLHSRNIAMC